MNTLCNSDACYSVKNTAQPCNGSPFDEGESSPFYPIRSNPPVKKVIMTQPLQWCFRGLQHSLETYTAAAGGRWIWCSPPAHGTVYPQWYPADPPSSSSAPVSGAPSLPSHHGHSHAQWYPRLCRSAPVYEPLASICHRRSDAQAPGDIQWRCGPLFMTTQSNGDIHQMRQSRALWNLFLK